MEILSDIREHFASVKKGIRKIESLPREYPAWSIRDNGWYGIMIPDVYNIDVVENFNNVKLYNDTIILENREIPMLLLICSKENLRYEFAALCEQFVYKENRKSLIDNPSKWWENWRMLLGNVLSNKESYSTLAELIILEKLLMNGERVKWTGVYGATHDIEGENKSFEVKSTTNRYGASITISGQHQLVSDKNLILYFCRVEKSNLGESIDSVIKRLVLLGYNEDDLEFPLKKVGLEKGSSLRREKYKVLEIREYKIDENFPRITKDSFKDGKIPEHIEHITYKVDLEGINYNLFK